MRERPILFSGPMVRAVLDGRKTQTRRVIPGAVVSGAGGLLWPGPDDGLSPRGRNGSTYDRLMLDNELPDFPATAARCPFGAPGDRLWVRETWRVSDHDFADPPTCWILEGKAGDSWWANPPESERPVMAAKFGTAQTHGAPDPRWRSPVFMPRWAARLALVVTDVRVERLQEITGEDVMAEGIGHLYGYDKRERGVPADARERFAELWNETNGKRAPWSSDPWVWVVTFKVTP